MKGNYYAILPAKVRHDKNLKPIAKLLFAEITALSNAKGYAYPTNSSLAELYEVSTRTITSYLKQLEDNGYIDIVIEKNAKGTYRYIYPLMDMNSNFQRGRSQFLGGKKDTSNGVEVSFHTKEYYKNNNINKYYKNKEGESHQKEEIKVPLSFEDIEIKVSYPASFTSELKEACEAYFEMRALKNKAFSSLSSKQAWVSSIAARVKAEGIDSVVSAIWEAVSNKWTSIYIREKKGKAKKTPSKAGKRIFEPHIQDKIYMCYNMGLLKPEYVNKVLSKQHDLEVEKYVNNLLKQKPIS